jgi:hypothetical protein
MGVGDYLSRGWGAVKRLHDPRQHIDKWGDLYGKTLGDEDESAIAQRDALNAQAAASGSFADRGQNQFRQLGGEAADVRKYLGGVAQGQNSISAEQLRQGLQQNMAAQRSMAASAAPRDSAMAARTAAIQSGRLGAGMSGQAALAGLQERRDAQSALGNMLMQQRQQELNAALGGRQTAIQGYQNITPEGTWKDKWAGAIGTGVGAAMSDKRVKEDIVDGDKEADRVLKGLKAYSYKYKDEKHGKGRQFGPMAQDMEKAGLGHAVFETPAGKAVDGAKAALSGLALTAALAKRVEKLEKGKK